MPNSISIDQSVICPNCGADLHYEIWALIDTRERPDLLARMLDETIDHMRCRCGEPALNTFPLIVFRPDETPPILLSRCDEEPPDADEWKLIAPILGHFRHQLGSNFKPEWLSRGMPAIRREDLAGFLRSQQPRKQEPVDPAAELLNRFIHTQTWDENRALLERHPELLDPRIESTIAALGLDNEPRVQQELLVLRRCRQEGIEAVFADLFDRGPLKILNDAERLINRQDFVHAFDLLHKAAPQCDRREYPRPWAWLNFALGLCLTQAPLLAEPERWRQAIFHLKQSLVVYDRSTDPIEWASAYVNLATAYGHVQSEDPAAGCDDQLRCLSHALEVFTAQADPDRWSRLQEQYAMLSYTGPVERRTTGRETAIERLEQIAAVLSPTKGPERWLRACVNLCALYRERTSGDHVDNVERAIHYGEGALKTGLPFPKDLNGVVHINLGAAYGDRLLGEQSDNTKSEIQHLTHALELLDPLTEAAQWATVQHDLGHAYFRSKSGDRVANLKQAIEHYRAALAVTPKDIRPSDYAQTLGNMATAYHQQAGNKHASDFDKALSMYLEAARIYQRGDNIAALCEMHYNLAVAYKDRVRGDREKNLARSWRHCRWIFDRDASQMAPTILRNTLGTAASLAFAQCDWKQTHAICQKFYAHSASDMHAAYTETSRATLTATAGTIYQIDAYSQLRLGDYAGALTILEMGKTRRMAEALAMGGAWLTQAPEVRLRIGAQWSKVRSLEEELRLPPETPDRRPNVVLTEALRQERARLDADIAALAPDNIDGFRTHLEASEMLALVPPGGAMISWLITSRGSAAIVLPSGISAVTDKNVVLLDALTSAHLDALLAGDVPEVSRGWIEAYGRQGEDHGAWRTAILEITAALWTHLVGPAVERLETLGVQRGTPVLMLPHAATAMLPLHAAWREVDGRPRYFIDDYAVFFAPSVLAYASSQRHLGSMSQSEPSLLAVVDSMKDLSCAKLEGEMIADMFSTNRRELLLGDDARPFHIIEKAKGKSHVHFACHGFCAWGDPLRSGLKTAGNRTLALWEIIAKMDLSQSRLVALSACESGLTDIFEAPHEFIGLPAGFMQAGAPGVVGTYWEVDDLSTMLLMVRFYQLHLQSALTPALALREAQLWLRGLTERDVEAELTQLNKSRSSARVRAKEPRGAGRPPFDHPYYWAAFALHGS